MDLQGSLAAVAAFGKPGGKSSVMLQRTSDCFWRIINVPRRSASDSLVARRGVVHLPGNPIIDI